LRQDVVGRIPPSRYFTAVSQVFPNILRKYLPRRSRSKRFASRAQNRVKVWRLIYDLVHMLIAANQRFDARRIRCCQYESIAVENGLSQMLEELPVPFIGRRDVVHDHARSVCAEKGLKIECAIADVVSVRAHNKKAGMFEQIFQKIDGIGTGVNDGDYITWISIYGGWHWLSL
jgi:hypothetical protein